MQQKTIILIDKDDKTHAFTSLKKASEVFKWVNPKSIYNLYGGCEDFTYKGVRIRRILLN